MTTRAALIADLDEWLARDDLSTGGNQDTFLRMAQATINRSLRIRDKEVTTTLTCTSRSTALPSDYLSARSITPVSSIDRRIEYLTPERIRESPIWLNQGGTHSSEGTVGMAYTIEANNIVLAPEPTAEAPVTLDLVYHARIGNLVNDGDTNDILTTHYDVYLYAILRAACVFLQETELAAGYSAMYNGAIDEVKKSQRWGRFSGSNLFATGNPRAVV